MPSSRAQRIHNSTLQLIWYALLIAGFGIFVRYYLGRTWLEVAMIAVAALTIGCVRLLGGERMRPLLVPLIVIGVILVGFALYPTYTERISPADRLAQRQTRITIPDTIPPDARISLTDNTGTNGSTNQQSTHTLTPGSSYEITHPSRIQYATATLSGAPVTIEGRDGTQIALFPQSLLTITLSSDPTDPTATTLSLRAGTLIASRPASPTRSLHIPHLSATPSANHAHTRSGTIVLAITTDSHDNNTDKSQPIVRRHTTGAQPPSRLAAATGARHDPSLVDTFAQLPPPPTPSLTQQRRDAQARVFDKTDALDTFAYTKGTILTTLSPRYDLEAHTRYRMLAQRASPSTGNTTPPSLTDYLPHNK